MIDLAHVTGGEAGGHASFAILHWLARRVARVARDTRGERGAAAYARVSFRPEVGEPLWALRLPTRDESRSLHA